MTPRVPETDDQTSWIALLAVQALNAVGLVLMIAAWPLLALADGLRRPTLVTIEVAPEHLPRLSAAPTPYLREFRLAA
ncbi:MAG: hypothetical protein V4597_17605 [Pseudomonadota bacterium]